MAKVIKSTSNSSNNSNQDLLDISSNGLKELIYNIRGQQVMLDFDLAEIYKYSTKDFNRQIRNNIERFDSDFMFQLTDIEVEDNLRCKFCTSSWGGRRYNPYAFTEQGIYMLMTVLKGDLAVRQSKALIRTFKQMKEFIVSNQSLIGQREYLQLSLQTSQNIHDILEVRSNLFELDNKVANIMSSLGDVVTQSQLANILLDFGNPAVRHGWLILNGQPVESDLAYKQIYSYANKSIIMIDNYINLKTLVLLKDVSNNIKITIVSDNVHRKLHDSEYKDFIREYSHLNISLLSAGEVIHDRYIILDYQTTNEKIYHCGASSKDGGNKVMTITQVTETAIYHIIVDSVLKNPPLHLN